MKDFVVFGGEDLWLEFECFGGDFESCLGCLCYVVLEFFEW